MYLAATNVMKTTYLKKVKRRLVRNLDRGRGGGVERGERNERDLGEKKGSTFLRDHRGPTDRQPGILKGQGSTALPLFSCMFWVS